MTTDHHLGHGAQRWGAPAADASLAVLAVHGRGQSPAFMQAVAEHVDLPQITYLAPAAEDNSWYPVSFLAPVADNEPKLSRALEVVARGRAQLLDEGFGPERTALLGFSQGACVLAEHLVRTGQRCAAASLLTGGYVGPPGDLRLAAGGDLGAMPVLLGVAEEDEWVPLSRVRETARLLEALHATVTLEVYDDREHIVSAAAVASTRRLLLNALSRPS